MISPAGPVAPKHQPPEAPARICECCSSPVSLEDYYRNCEFCGADWAPSPEKLWATIAAIGRLIEELYGPNFGPPAATSIEREATT